MSGIYWSIILLNTILFASGFLVGWSFRAKIYTKREMEFFTRLSEERNDVIRLEKEKDWLNEELAK